MKLAFCFDLIHLPHDFDSLSAHTAMNASEWTLPTSKPTVEPFILSWGVISQKISCN
jgi:hypothetical protein